MAVTLAQAKLDVQDKLTAGVIDEFAKNSFILRNLPFDDCVSPTGGGATMTYSYTRLVTQPTAAFRKINAEYTAQEVEKQRYSTDLKVLGGSFGVDRVIANMGGIIKEVDLQLSQKIKGSAALFNETVINGDSAQDADVFDGLDVALTGGPTEEAINIDLSSSANVTSNYMAFLDELDEWLGLLDREPSALLMNQKMLAKMRACARRASMYQTTKDNWGRQVEMYGNIPMIDLGARMGSNNPVVETDGSTGKTAIYAASFGLDALHGISMAGQPLVQTWLPDYKTSGAVKTGEVEMVCGIALKTTKSNGVLRGIKVQ